MFPLLMLFQQLRATQPGYFFLVTLLLLIAGGIGWLIAARLWFLRSPAVAPSSGVGCFARVVFVCLFYYLSPAVPAVWRARVPRDQSKLGGPFDGFGSRSIF